MIGNYHMVVNQFDKNMYEMMVNFVLDDPELFLYDILN